MIEFICPQCKHNWSVGDDRAGKKARCTCGELIPVPSALPASNAPPSSPFIIDDEPYIMEEGGKNGKLRFFCQSCKKVSEGLECSQCGGSRSEGMNGHCMFCGTSYCCAPQNISREDFIAQRKYCPVCSVEENMEKASRVPTNATPDEVKEGLARWQAGYMEAKAKGYRFSMDNHLTHARLLVQVDYGYEAWRLLMYCFNGSGRSMEKLSRVHEAMSFHVGVEANRRDLDGLRVDSVTHGVLSFLFKRMQLNQNQQRMPANNAGTGGDEQEDKHYIHQMKSLLRSVGRNQKGKAEQLYVVLRKHWQLLPKINEHSLKQDIGILVQAAPPQ